MANRKVLYGGCAVALGFALGFLVGVRRSQKQIRQARQAAKDASEQTTHLMELMLPSEKPQ